MVNRVPGYGRWGRGIVGVQTHDDLHPQESTPSGIGHARLAMAMARLYQVQNDPSITRVSGVYLQGLCRLEHKHPRKM
jgi:hypothetical protein